MVALHTAIAIVLAVGLIIRFKVDPVISLLLASLYLGLASGVGFTGTIEAIAVGFGEIMAEVGLLIGFGVLIGAFLHAAGVFHRLVDVFVRVDRRQPAALRALLLYSTILPSIYVDVQVVLASPVARSAAPYIDRNGLPLMASALGAGIFAGYVFVVPGLAAISIAGLLGVPLGTLAALRDRDRPVTAIITSLIMRLLLRGRLWKPETDEDVDEAMAEQEAHEMAGVDARAGAAAGQARRRRRRRGRQGGRRRRGPIAATGVLLLPILVPLLMIAFGAFAELFGSPTPSSSSSAMRTSRSSSASLGAYLLFRTTAGLERTRETMDEGFHTTGEILLITGVGGSLGAVIGETTLDTVLAGLFQAERRTCDPEHPAGVVHCRSAAPGDRIGVGRRDHRGRDHRTDPRLPRCGSGRHRAGHRVGRTVRPTGQQQLLLDVQGSARSVHQRQPQDPDRGHVGRLGGVAADGHRGVVIA